MEPFQHKIRLCFCRMLHLHNQTSNTVITSSGMPCIGMPCIALLCDRTHAGILLDRNDYVSPLITLGLYDNHRLVATVKV